MKQQATPYLTFKGNAREALMFYKEIFNGEIEGIQTFGEADFPTPPQADELIMHARMRSGELLLMMSDAFLGQNVEIGNHISLALELHNDEEIEDMYEKLKAEGSVLMELQDTFWGAKFAKVKDKFGIIWDLNYTKKESKVN
ncbi:VOC family protein [Marinicrinis sediminis]|uniref:VOC family protein n=1 Tax=Marinicrinis sediminis TaxID=1652465 RepID=A0ABW5RAF3_9BACL